MTIRADATRIRLEQSKALASETRMKILALLSDPKKHFSDQRYQDPVAVGVCVTMLTERLGLKQPTVSRHLELLSRAGFVSVTKIDRWSFYSRNNEGIAEYTCWLAENL